MDCEKQKNFKNQKAEAEGNRFIDIQLQPHACSKDGRLAISTNAVWPKC